MPFRTGLARFGIIRYQNLLASFFYAEITYFHCITLYKIHRFYAVFFTYAKHSQRRAMIPEKPITLPPYPASIKAPSQGRW